MRTSLKVVVTWGFLIRLLTDNMAKKIYSGKKVCGGHYI
jgi:hypothetical protein